MEQKKEAKYYSSFTKFAKYDVIILKIIAQSSEPFKPADIGYKCKCPPSTVYNTLNRLEEKGIVKKIENDNKWYCINREELRSKLHSQLDELISYIYKDEGDLLFNGQK